MSRLNRIRQFLAIVSDDPTADLLKPEAVEVARSSLAEWLEDPDPDSPPDLIESVRAHLEGSVPVMAAALKPRGQVRKPATAEPVESKPRALVAAAVGTDSYGESFAHPAEAGEALLAAARRGGQGEQTVLRSAVSGIPQLGQDRWENEKTLTRIMTEAAEARAEGVALTAAGFCSPAQPVYEFFDAASPSGVIELAEVEASRGRVIVPTPISPKDLVDTAGIGTEFTAAQDQAGSAKSCFEVVCGTEDTYEVTATYTCLRFSNFDTFFPEKVSHLTGQAMVTAAHNTNQRLIEDIVTSPRTTFVNDLEDGGGALVSLVRSVARTSAFFRQEHKMAVDAPLDLILPSWVARALSADATARDSSHGTNLVLSLAEVTTLLRRLAVFPQFVHDWQVQGNAGGWDGFTSYLLFPPGGVVRLRGNTIDLGVVRDHTLNLANDFSVFVETFDGIAVRASEVLYVSGVGICPTGATAARVTLTCAGS